ncbi:diacylglycerol/lipid kinase family protein [Hansschlegelia sp.]|uniref:diacylglycerol/lipid kinase family protein n=1 Tax=Hansschlegelia sp. TaxID=2041892 RepID=UPI002B9B7728|nr:diacylglycerol kinase family protein [Hansschlegelia sp.]HVI28900.1 diacylglycerol kinase family protein [Hansschlegelia sp.]
MKIALVINRSSGALLGLTDAPGDLERKLAEAGFEVGAVLDGDASDLSARIERASRLPVDAVITAGGDGTIMTAAQALAGTGKALGPLPLGTMNLLARDLGIPIDLDEAIAALATADRVPIDMGDVNGHVFLCNSMLGVPARLAERRERSREDMGLTGWWRLAAAGLKGLYRYPPLRVGLDLGHGPVTIRSKAIVVANNAYDEGFGHFLSRSSLDRGELALYVTRRLSAWPIIRISARIAIGSWKQDPDLETYGVRELTVTSRRKLLRVMNDGETMLLKPPLLYRTRPKALLALRPRSGQAAPAEAAA